MTSSSKATSAAVANATQLGNFSFGMFVVFDDPMTKDNHLLFPPVARAQGFYLYEMKTQYNAWFAYTLVFYSTEYKGTLNIMGADMMGQKTRDLSFLWSEAQEISSWPEGLRRLRPILYRVLNIRLKMDIKLYECY